MEDAAETAEGEQAGAALVARLAAVGAPPEMPTKYGIAFLAIKEALPPKLVKVVSGGVTRVYLEQLVTGLLSYAFFFDIKFDEG
jgi:hypothetical protein